MANAVSPPEPIYLVGPTASGKTDIAIALAERLGAVEIIGADAFQVYRGLDLLTAKPEAAALARVAHHLIGEIPLSERFDVAQYRTLATEHMGRIHSREHIPLVVGGTGLYVRALTHGLAELPSADPELRAELDKQTLSELVRRLEELDPEAAAKIDCHNPRRVVRALEVCLLTGRPFSSFQVQSKPAGAIRGFTLLRDREELYARIEERTRQMFVHGVVEEVRTAGEVSETAAQVIGWQPIQALISGQITEQECIGRIQQQTRNYAKRQLTWFRRESHLTPVEVAVGEDPAAVANRLLHALTTLG